MGEQDTAHRHRGAARRSGAPSAVVWAALALVALWGAASGCASVGGASEGLGQAVTASPEAPTHLRVVSWNVGLGVFLDHTDRRLSRLSRGGWSVRNALAHHPELRRFDVLGVQELCSHGDGVHIRAIEDVFPYHRFFGRSDPKRRGECEKGEAIFSRYPIARSGVIQLPPIRRIGRSAVWADVEVPQGEEVRTVRIYNVHLDNAAGEGVEAPEGRWVQMQEVLEHYRAWREEHGEDGVIFLGDFNALGELYDPWSDERTIAEVKQRFRPAVDGEFTWLALYQLDWIFYEALELVSGQVVRVLLSDHFPVVAEFALPRRGKAQGQ